MNLITFLHITLESGFAMFCLLAVLSIRMYDTREVSEQGGNAGIITGRYFVISLIL